MVIKGQVEIPNETKTGFDVLHGETSADMVLYNDTTVADVLEDLIENGGGSAVDVNAFTDTFVVQVSGKVLSTNDFTDEDKAKLDSLSTDTQTVDLSGVMRVYVGSVEPTDTSVIWFDTSAYVE